MATGNEANRPTTSCKRFTNRPAEKWSTWLMIRPESVAIGHRGGRDHDAKAVVVGRSFFGHDQLVELELESGRRLRSRRLGFPAWHPGDHVRVWVDGPVTALAVDHPPAGTAR